MLCRQMEICDNEPDWLEAQVPLLRAIARKLEDRATSPANLFIFITIKCKSLSRMKRNRIRDLTIYNKRSVTWLFGNCPNLYDCFVIASCLELK